MAMVNYEEVPLAKSLEWLKTCKPDVTEFLLACVRSLGGVYEDNGCGWIGHVYYHKVAEAIGMNENRAYAIADKLSEQDLIEYRNDGDGWMTTAAVEVFQHLTQPSLPPT